MRPARRLARQAALARPVLSALAVLATLAAILGGCGSSDNNIAAKQPAEIVEASKNAVSKAESVTIDSKTAQGRLVLAANLQLTRNGGQGKVTLLGLNFELKRIGGTLYFKGGPLFYRRLGLKQKVPTNTWVKVPSAQLARLSALTELAKEAPRAMSAHGTITKGATTKIDGEPALELKNEGKLFKGRLYIKTTGEPYPLKLVKTGAEVGQTTFTDWNNTPAPSAAPTHTTTISR